MKRILAVLVLCGGIIGLRAQPAPHTHLVIIVDGMRPDYVTRQVMPRLYALGQRGVVFTAHHSVFPTVTRVNSSSFTTGSYPETHGLMGNTIYIPKANATAGLDTGEKSNLEAAERAEGLLLTAPTIGEILAKAGKKVLAVSSGSSGSIYLLNHTTPGGTTIHYDFTYPATLAAHVAQVIGPPPPSATPNDGRNQWAVDAYLKVGLDEIHPDLTFMWINDPDGTAHESGIGTELTNRSLSLVDAGIGRIEDTLRAKGLLDRTNIIVTSDHGFSTHTGGFRLAAFVEPFAKTMPDGTKDIVVAEGAVYLRSGNDPARVAAIVAALQQQPAVGAIFTRPRPGGGSEGVVPGTLSFDVAHWNHPRAGDILVSPNWTNNKNEHGFSGTTTAGGVAGHGSSSVWDIHNALIAAGPDFVQHVTSVVPTANVDIAPTLMRLLGLSPVPSMTGRVMGEVLPNSAGIAGSNVVQRMDETVSNADGSYRLTAHISLVNGPNGSRYLDSTEVQRR